MEIESDYNKRDECVLFCDDLPDGSCLVQCPCGEEISSNNLVCPICNKKLKYPGWASW